MKTMTVREGRATPPGTEGAAGARMSASKRWTMVAVVLGSGAVFLDSTVVNVALPKIGQELPSRVFGVLEGQSLVYNGYLLTLSALLILAGALSDYYGRRRMFAIGLAAFGVTSLLAGLAPTMETLIAARVLQGAAGALLVPASLAIITAAFRGEEQGRAFGIWAGASAATTVLGPFVGGILVDSISWRAAFLINIPITVLAWYATARHVRESRGEEAEGGFDWLGAGVIALAVGGLTFGAIRGQEHQWQDPAAFVALAVGAAATVAFPFLMRRVRRPLVPLHLFGSRNFTVTNISTLLIYGAIYVSVYFATLFMQGTLGYSAAAAGLAQVPAFVFLMLFASRFGQLAARLGFRRFMAAGPAVMGVGLLWLARIPAGSDAWVISASRPASILPPGDYLIDFLPGLALYGIGLMILVAPLTTALMTSVPTRHSGVASAINNAISRVGPQLAGALIFVAITAAFYQGLSDRVPELDVRSPAVRADIAPLNPPAEGVPAAHVAAAREASTGAFRIAMVVAAGLAFAGAVTNGVGIRNRPAVAEEPAGEGPPPAAEHQAVVG